jgi:hypothetical protein
MEEISSNVLAVVQTHFAGLSEEGRTQLSDCLRHLANVIEAQCPAVLIPGARGGVATAYGPQGVHPGEMLVAAATPKAGVMLALAERSDDFEATVGEFSGTALADAVALAVDTSTESEDAGNLAALGNGISLLLGKANRDRLRKEVAEVYAKGLTPLLVVLISAGPRLSTYLGLVTSPSRFEDQIARIEAAEHSALITGDDPCL